MIVYEGAVRGNSLKSYPKKEEIKEKMGRSEKSIFNGISTYIFICTQNRMMMVVTDDLIIFHTANKHEY